MLCLNCEIIQGHKSVNSGYKSWLGPALSLATLVPHLSEDSHSRMRSTFPPSGDSVHHLWFVVQRGLSTSEGR